MRNPIKNDSEDVTLICELLEQPVPELPKGKLFDYQRNALNQTIANPKAVIDVPKGAGKTNHS